MTTASEFQDEPWYRAACAERARCRELLGRSAEIRDRIGVAGRCLDAVVAEARRLLAASRAERSAREGRPPPADPAHDGLSRVLRDAGMDEEDLPDLLDGLVAAYRDAVAADDDLAVAVLGQVLRSVGRHLAERLGPLRAGVSLN